MKAPVWVRRDVVLAVQEMLLAEHGGAAGIRDEGMLDSALGRPENLSLTANQPSSNSRLPTLSVSPKTTRLSTATNASVSRRAFYFWN